MEENNVENNEIKEIEEGNNGIKIANDVISVIAGVAVSEVPGVASMAGGFAGGITEVLSGKKNLSKGIKVDADEKEVRIDVNIIVEYGTRIPDIAFEIQNRVKKAVENMGLGADVEYITDMEKVMSYGAMSMPAIVVNEQVVSMGKVLKAAQVEKLLKKLGC